MVSSPRLLRVGILSQVQSRANMRAILVLGERETRSPRSLDLVESISKLRSWQRAQWYIVFRHLCVLGGVHCSSVVLVPVHSGGFWQLFRGAEAIAFILGRMEIYQLLTKLITLWTPCKLLPGKVVGTKGTAAVP